MNRLEKKKLEDGFFSDMVRIFYLLLVWNRMIECRNSFTHISMQTMLLSIKNSLGKKAGRFGKTLVMGDNSLTLAYTSVKELKREVNCKNLENMIAIHLSHGSIDNALKQNKFPIIGLDTLRDAMELRGDAALIFSEDYENQCQIKLKAK
jgi:hypothetical protein